MTWYVVATLIGFMALVMRCLWLEAELSRSAAKIDRLERAMKISDCVSGSGDTIRMTGRKSENAVEM